MRPILLRSRIFYGLLSVLLLSLTCFYSNAQASQHRVTINGIVPLKAVFKAIKKQTGFAVMYNTNITMLNQEEKVTVDFKDTPLDEVLTFLLRGKGLGWTYNDDVVVIHKKEVVAPKKNEGDSTVTPAMLTGKVTDAEGSPLPGVTVQVKGTMQGTTTDADGRFALAKVGNGEVLVISSIGYEKREVVVKGRTILTQMNVDVSSLDETVVIAYGTTTPRLSTGNVNSVKAKDIAKQPVNNPLLALQGRVPGLFITQANGLPGSGITVRVQGQNSIYNGNAPLYVVDGVPYPTETPGQGLGPLGNSGEKANGSESGTGNALSYINPSDIESIDVLKDADATAIYGSRAANGAILITTKKGKSGKLTLDINLQHGWGRVTRKLQMLNTLQYVQMRHEAFANDGESPTVDNAPDLLIWDTSRYTNWQKTLIGGTSEYTNANVSLSGGTTAIRYLVRGTYQRETTVFPGSFSDQRGGVHFNINSTSANQKFNLQLTGNYLFDNNQLPRSDLTEPAIPLEPNAPALYNADGTLNWMPNAAGSSTWNNPLALLYNTYQNKTANLIGNAVFSYQILPGLDFRSSLGYNSLQSNEWQLNPLIAIRPEQRPSSERSAVYGNRRLNSWIIEPQLTYKKKIGKGKLDLLLGTTIQQSLNNGELVFGSGHNSDNELKNISAASSLYALSNATTYKYTALFSRINYNWQDKYIVNLTARRDGSSRFGTRNQFSNFGAIGLAWIFTEENFVRKNLQLLSFGKLRGSYGITGNDQLGDYSFMSLYYPLSVGVPYQGSLGQLPNSIPNPYLEWEATRKLQFGIDLGFFKDRILLNTTYIRNRSSNQLLFYAVPSITGQDGVYQNFPATVQNTGWEFMLNTINLKDKNFTWTSSVNLTIPRNKLIDFPNLSSSTYARRLFIGHPVSVTRLYHFLGVDPATGEYTVADSDGKATTSPNSRTDRTILANTLPKFYGGVQNSFSYKSINVDLLFQFVKQIGVNTLFSNGSGTVPGSFSEGQSNQPVTVVDRWQKPGDITSIQRYSTGNLSAGLALSSDAALSDASYIRLKNLSISWVLPTQWQQKAHVQHCRVYIQGQNLLTITNYRGMDPETQTVNSLPPLKILTIGLQIGL